MRGRGRMIPDLYSMGKDLLQNWWVILMAGGTVWLCFGILILTGWRSGYTSAATVIVTGTARSGDSFTTYSRQAEPFIGILTDPFLLQETADELGYDQSEVSAKARVIAETNLIAVEVRAAQPTMAYQMLKGILRRYRELSDVMLPGYFLLELIPPAYPSGEDRASVLRRYCIPGTGAAVGIVMSVICMLSCQRDVIRNQDEAIQKLDARVFGVIGHERKERQAGIGWKSLWNTAGILHVRKAQAENIENGIKKTVLIHSPLVSSEFVEAYAQLRDRLLIHCEKYEQKVIMITSMYENEGKSTVAANLALAFAERSNQVLLLDADLRKPAQYRIFQKREEDTKWLPAYLRGEAKLTDMRCLRYREAESDCYLICSGERCLDSTELAGGKRMKELIDAFRERVDYIIIDTPPLALLADAEEIAAFCDMTLLVVRAGQAETESINDTIAALGSVSAGIPGCVLNNVHTISGMAAQYLHMEWLKQSL